MKLLSIIVPFHNSSEKCTRLIETLSRATYPDVEIICVDDGSQDNTLEVLSDFKSWATCDVKIITQENKGPGGARNAGLSTADGQYLWFVDSDDDIDLDVALHVLSENLEHDPDFVDFNIYSGREVFCSMKLAPGIYGEHEEVLASKFGRICSKIFHSRIFKGTGIRYPEHCIYEDNALLFILPLFVKKFIVHAACAYVHHEEYESITRGSRSSRYFDRMVTAYWGYSTSKNIEQSLSIREMMKSRFIRLYLIDTGRITPVPSLSWLEKMRVMKQFKEDARRLGVAEYRHLIRELLSNASLKYRLAFWVLYYTSYFLPSQEAYFQNQRLNAWGRPFLPPQLSTVRSE